MATYQVMYWKTIPAQVKASDAAGGRHKVMLSDRFSESIDATAMADGSAGSDDYLDAWAWSDGEERDGDAKTVAEAVAAELEEAYPKSRLVQMIRDAKKAADGA